jgi:hypothetical protein
MTKTTASHLIARAGLTVLLAAGPIGRSPALIAATAPSPRVLTASISAAGLTHLDLTALDGQVDITTSADPSADAISISVSLDPPRLQNFLRAKPADVDTVALRTVNNQNVLRVGLTNARAGNIEANWTIVVPARFSARVDSHDGAISISGLEGGIDAEVNSGLGGHGARMTIDVPRGRVALSVGVGDITLRRRSAAFDRADISASVGNAKLYVLGHEIKAPHEPGPGHRIQLDGDGPDVIKARVSVGDVSVHIG